MLCCVCHCRPLRLRLLKAGGVGAPSVLLPAISDRLRQVRSLGPSHAHPADESSKAAALQVEADKARRADRLERDPDYDEQQGVQRNFVSGKGCGCCVRQGLRATG